MTLDLSSSSRVCAHCINPRNAGVMQAISTPPSLSLPSPCLPPPPTYSGLHAQWIIGHSRVYSCFCLLFLVTVTMFTHSLLIMYLCESLVLKKALVSCVEQASGIRVPSVFSFFPGISFCQPFWQLINSYTASSLSLSLSVPCNKALVMWWQIQRGNPILFTQWLC